MYEIVRVVFSPNFSKLPNLDKTTVRQVFKNAVIEPIAVIELHHFWVLWTPLLHRTWLYLKCGWPYGHGDPTSVFLVKFYSKIRYFCKNLKIVQNG